MAHVTIIGGGIAGLATAYYLQQRAKAAGVPLQYTLAEAGAQWGGKIATTTAEGFVIEGGPDSFVMTTPHGATLCRELGLGESLIPINKRPVYVLKHGQLIRFPLGFRLAVPTQIWPLVTTRLFSPLGKLRMGLEWAVPRRKDPSDESLASFIRRRLGQEALDYLGEPLMAGIYVGDAEKLSIASTFPMFVDLEQRYGSVMRGMQAARRERLARQRQTGSTAEPPSFLTLKGGLSQLVAALTQQLTGTLRLNCPIADVRRERADHWRVTPASGEPWHSDAVVLALPGFAAAPLVRAVDGALAQGLEAIRYVDTATVSLGFKRADLGDSFTFDGLGFVIPSAEHRRMLACTVSSNKFNGRCADDQLLIRAFFGGDGQEEDARLPDAEILALARSEIGDLLGVRATPIISRIFRWPRGNPQYDVGHLARVARLEAQATEHQGLYLTGSAFRGIGIPSCVNYAATLAGTIATQLGWPAPPKPDTKTAAPPAK